jgi:alanine racemase
MHRLGLRHDELHRTLPAILANDHLGLEGVFTHFASAEAPDSTMFDQQCERFETASQSLMQLMAASDRGPGSRRQRVLRHACNSAALLRGPRAWYDAVRPGLLLYGVVPPPLSLKICLQPVMSVTSRIVSLKELHEGEGVGYGSRFRASARCTIAVIPAGYADGVDPRLSGRGQVLVRGHRVPIVGAVSMDMITVDVTDASDVQLGDEVVLLGEQGSESWQHIDARELAAAIGTNPWEVLCRLGPRIERRVNR